MITDNVSDLEAGDNVIVYTTCDRELKKVERKTKSAIFVNGKRFNFRGRATGERSGFYWSFINPATETEMASYWKHVSAKKRKALIAEWRSLTVSEAIDAEALEDIIKRLKVSVAE